MLNKVALVIRSDEERNFLTLVALAVDKQGQGPIPNRYNSDSTDRNGTCRLHNRTLRFQIWNSKKEQLMKAPADIADKNKTHAKAEENDEYQGTPHGKHMEPQLGTLV